MVLLMCFVVIDDSLHNTRDKDTEGEGDHMLSVHDGPGKSFVILLSYKKCTQYTRDQNNVGEKDCRSSVYDVFCKSFLILLRYKNYV